MVHFSSWHVDFFLSSEWLFWYTITAKPADRIPNLIFFKVEIPLLKSTLLEKFDFEDTTFITF